MGKRLVLVGAGHAHLTVLKNLAAFTQKNHHVTVVSSGVYHYYSGMGPGMLSGLYTPEEIRFHVQKMVEDRGGTFIEDTVVKIDPTARQLSLQTDGAIEYDVISFNTGSHIPVSQDLTPPESVFTVKPIENLLKARKKIIEGLKKQPMTITIAGGGAAGVEIAANVWRLVNKEQGNATIYLIAGNTLLPRYHRKIREHALTSLTRHGIKVLEGVKLQRFHNGLVELTDGSKFESQVLLMAVGTRPSPIFQDSGIPIGEDGGLLVNKYLQSVAHPEIFGGGDCISFAPRLLAKIGIYAVRQNPILLHNLLTALNGGNYQEFIPQTSYMLILNMGDGKGIVFRNSFIWQGRLAFILKDYIDRKFMRTFAK